MGAGIAPYCGRKGEPARKKAPDIQGVEYPGPGLRLRWAGGNSFFPNVLRESPADRFAAIPRTNKPSARTVRSSPLGLARPFVTAAAVLLRSCRARLPPGSHANGFIRLTDHSAAERYFEVADRDLKDNQLAHPTPVCVLQLPVPRHGFATNASLALPSFAANGTGGATS